MQGIMTSKIFLILLLLILLSGCISITERKNNTYELEGVPSNYRVGIFDSSFDEAVQSLIINNTNDNTKTEWFMFDLTQRGKIDIGKQFMGEEDDRKYLYTEPFDLNMYFFIDYGKEQGNIQKIVVNRMFFKSKKHSIDLREKIGVYYISEQPVYPFSYKYIPEDILADFRKFGTIDVMNLNIENGNMIERSNSVELGFMYNDIDVIFKKDRKFSIEYDITLVRDIEGSETENYVFTANFKRKRFSDKYNLLLGILFGLAMR